VTGDGVILTTPPSNVYHTTTGGVHDLDGPRVDGKLVIGGFDEKQNVLLSSNININPTTTLLAGHSYDSHFVFFHQITPQSFSLAAKATFVTDNRFVGCSSSDGSGSDGAFEISTTGVFGLDGVLYPTTTAAARGYESGDFAIGSGTSFTNDLTIVQPGDFVRCISESCRDDAGGPCSCTVSRPPSNLCLKPLSLGGVSYACFPSISELVPTSELGFSSTCPVDIASLVVSIAECSPASGCIPTTGTGFCLRSAEFGGSATVTVRVTAGCGCDKEFDVVVPISSAPGCHFVGCD